jgi:hypothetical protein
VLGPLDQPASGRDDLLDWRVDLTSVLRMEAKMLQASSGANWFIRRCQS